MESARKSVYKKFGEILMKQMKNRSKEYYSQMKVADGYDEERFTTAGGKMFDTFEKNIVILNLPKNRGGVKVLGAGAGSGRFTVEMVKGGFDVVSSDYSPAMLDVIQSKIKNIGFENNVTRSEQDLTNLTFNDDEFDFICCMPCMQTGRNCGF